MMKTSLGAVQRQSLHCCLYLYGIGILSLLLSEAAHTIRHAPTSLRVS